MNIKDIPTAELERELARRKAEERDVDFCCYCGIKMPDNNPCYKNPFSTNHVGAS